MDIGFVWWTSLKSHDILFWFSVLCMSERGRKPAIEEYNFGLCKSANMDATIVLVSIFSSSRSIDMREIKLCHLYSGRSIKVAATKAHCPNLLPVRHRILLICLSFTCQHSFWSPHACWRPPLSVCQRARSSPVLWRSSTRR